MREGAHQREPGEHISEAVHVVPPLEELKAVSLSDGRPVREDQTVGVNIRNWSNTGNFWVGERAT